MTQQITVVLAFAEQMRQHIFQAVLLHDDELICGGGVGYPLHELHQGLGHSGQVALGASVPSQAAKGAAGAAGAAAV